MFLEYASPLRLFTPGSREGELPFLRLLPLLKHLLQSGRIASMETKMIYSGIKQEC